ncbi:hypothetical protein CCH79_00019962 [Gambusia affinis]|uniref:SRCR domain-containing protein n=1 Tax=Gambusia affinis TaxID=33528 RepID=A0A315VMV7_GAMAF|nr:hypothetical protein CCH79_00019962 [Gambusia affinis]
MADDVDPIAIVQEDLLDLKGLRVHLDCKEKRASQEKRVIKVRLVPGQNRGRVEVMHSNIWGTICDDSFGTLDGRVICKMLGFQSVVSTFTATPGTGKIWLDELQCTGAESDIFDCPHNEVGVHNCNHDEDVGVYSGVLERRVRRIVEPRIQEEQCGFRPGRGTLDQLYTLSRVLEGSGSSPNQSTCVLWTWRKAFDRVPRGALWGVLQDYEVPGSLIRAVRSLYDRRQSLVRIAGSKSGSFPVRVGLRQLSPER